MEKAKTRRHLEESAVTNATKVDPPVHPTAPAVERQLSTEERFTAGKALRDRTPRVEHAKWKRAESRTDPVDTLMASDGDRVADLVPIRYGRMMQSPFAFYRGSAALMAADLATTPATDVRVQACGDCHLMNFGGFATPERSILFDINDFDETLPAPWEWDIKRLAASFVLAARANNMSDSDARDAAVAATRSYRKRMRSFAEMHPIDVWYARITSEDVISLVPPAEQARIRKRVAKIAQQDGSEADFPKLADVVGGRLGIRDTPPLIFHPEVTRAPDFHAVLSQVMASYRETLPDDRRVLLDRYHLVDAAMKVVGVGSVGRRCWIALMMSASNDPLFLQFKEAVASVLEPYAGASEYSHHGQRVVAGQRLTQPASDMFLGWVTAQANGRQFYVRQLRDAKIKALVETFDKTLLTVYARACGWVLARAHAKSGDAAMISGYLGGNDVFDKAMGDFAMTYADQAERDHATLKAAVRKGKVRAFLEA
ncbi:MAG: DUF2252 domain-containing protein [Proteobacteria bacterium]|nr:DUF2252 domain-containing protein [Pseudomonadota bacterium]